VGQLADLVLLEGNPLKDIRNTQRIRAAVADGRLYVVLTSTASSRRSKR
jgi:imidazolonepropionase-like amidohydrolase